MVLFTATSLCCGLATNIYELVVLRALQALGGGAFTRNVKDFEPAGIPVLNPFTGSCAITGLPGQPAKSGIPVADIGTALYAYSSVLAALYERERTGRGAVIPIAMLDVAAEMMGSSLNQVLHGGGEPQPALGEDTDAIRAEVGEPG